MEIEELNKVNDRTFWPVVILCFAVAFIMGLLLFYNSYNQKSVDETNLISESLTVVATNEQIDSKGGFLKTIGSKITDGVSKIFSSNKSKEELQDTDSANVVNLEDPKNLIQDNSNNVSEDIESTNDAAELNPNVQNYSDANYKQIIAGKNHTCVLLTEGLVKCWGNNQYGQLGDGTTTNKTFNQATMVSNLTDVKQITAGQNFNCALLNNGRVKCWGINKELDGYQQVIGGALGQGACKGVNSTDEQTIHFYNKMGYNCDLNFSPVPLEIPANFLNNVKKIESDGFGVCALLENKTVKCWGRGTLAIGGDVFDQSSFYPVSIPNLVNVKDISVGNPICAILENTVDAKIQDKSTFIYTDGTDNSNVKCWGSTYNGNLYFFGNIIPGVSTGSQTATQPIAVPLKDVKQIKDTCALFNDGRIGCWGRNVSVSVNNPVLREHIVYLDSSISYKRIIGGALDYPSVFSTCVLTIDNKVKCFGLSVQNNSLNYNLLVPKQVSWINENLVVDDIATGYLGLFSFNNDVSQHTCVIKNNGKIIQCRGRNDNGQLGYCTDLEYQSGDIKIQYNVDFKDVGLNCIETIPEDTNTTEDNEVLPDTNNSTESLYAPTLALATSRNSFGFGGGTIKITNICNGCSVWYTTDGTIPTSVNKLVASSTNNEIVLSIFTGAEILQNGNLITVKAKAIKGTQESEVISKTYYYPEIPTFSSGTYTSDIYNNEVSINPIILPYNGGITITKPGTCQTCKIYYCLNCSENTSPQTGGFLPTVQILEYTDPILITSPTKISAYTVSTDGISSNIINSNNYQVLEPPVFSKPEGTVSSGTQISLSTNTNQTIYYTTDGTEPTRQSSIYSSPISIFSTTTIKAKIINIYNMHSQTITRTYTIGGNTIQEFQLLSDITEMEQNNYGLATKVISKDITNDGFKEFIVLYTQYYQHTGRRYRLVSYKYNLYSQTLAEKKEIFLNFSNNSWTNFEPVELYHLSGNKYLVVGSNGIKKIDTSISTNPLNGVLWEYSFSTITGQNQTYAGITSEMDSENNIVFTGRVYPNVTDILLIKMNVSSDTGPTNIWNKSFTASCENPNDGNPHSCYSSYVKSKFLLNNNKIIFYYLQSGVRLLSINLQDGQILWDVNRSTSLKTIYPEMISLVKGNGDLIYTDVNNTNYILYRLNKDSGNVNWTSTVQLPGSNITLPPQIISESNYFVLSYNYGMNSSSYMYLKEYYKLNVDNGEIIKTILPQAILQKIPSIRTYYIQKQLYNSNTNEFIYLFTGGPYSGIINADSPHVNLLKMDSSFNPYTFMYPITTNYGVYSQYNYETQAVTSFIKDNDLYVAGYSQKQNMLYQYTDNKIFISKLNLQNSKLPVFDYHKNINLGNLNYSFNKDVYWSDPNMEAKPYVYFELLNSNYGLLFVPNLMKKDTNGSAALISVINLNNSDYKNNFKITAPEVLTPVSCNDGSNNYCINFDLGLTESASISIFPSNSDLSVLTTGNFSYYNSLDSNPKITKHWKLNEIASGNTTHYIKTDYADEYYINIYSYSANDGSTDSENPKINKRQMHRIKINSINN